MQLLRQSGSPGSPAPRRRCGVESRRSGFARRPQLQPAARMPTIINKHININTVACLEDPDCRRARQLQGLAELLVAEGGRDRAFPVTPEASQDTLQTPTSMHTKPDIPRRIPLNATDAFAQAATILRLGSGPLQGCVRPGHWAAVDPAEAFPSSSAAQTHLIAQIVAQGHGNVVMKRMAADLAQSKQSCTGSGLGCDGRVRELVDRTGY